MYKFQITCLFAGIIFSVLAASLAGNYAFASDSNNQPEENPFQYHHDINNTDCCLVIAHAGGGLEGHYYTNSLEALDSNYRAGQRVFELDFRISADGGLVLLHDWKWNNNRPVSTQQFTDCKQCPAGKLGLTSMDIDMLLEWLQDHPDTTIITDAKDGFSQFLDALTRQVPVQILERHFIIQVYNTGDSGKLLSRLPGIPAIFTIYRSGFDETSIRMLDEFTNLSGLTMPLARAENLLPLIRKTFPGLPVYIHGKPQYINDPGIHCKFSSLGASGFYLD